METAKVDIRKLQQLNDRINQCLDALNQVRLSVHGLSHTAAPGQPGTPFGSYGSIPDPRVGFGIQDPRQGFGIGAVAPGYESGLQHSTIPQLPFPQVAPFTPMFGQPVVGQIPQIPTWNPLQAGLPGLSHSGIAGLEAAPYGIYGRPIWADPMLAARVAQTFPYVQLAVPPMVSPF